MPSSANIDQENQCITINKFAESLGVSAGSAVKIMDIWVIQKCVQGESQGSSQRLVHNPA